MMRREKFAIANIYVPIKRRATLKPETVQEIARSILEVGLQAPILVRRDGDRFVLVHGLHRSVELKRRSNYFREYALSEVIGGSSVPPLDGTAHRWNLLFRSMALFGRLLHSLEQITASVRDCRHA